jgi:hypothetical protein
LPLQNRVTPFGTLVAIGERGTLMGNRGCLHDEGRRIRRPFAGKRWILCLLEFRGRRRAVMAPGRYTELFFLDEATGLAAGHRPCAECQRERFRLFQSTWGRANPDVGGLKPSADAMDAALHAERLDGRRQKRTYEERLDRLPDGAMVVIEGDERPFLVVGESLVPWSPGGYGPHVAWPGGATVRVLTPRSVVRALAAGYSVVLHASVVPQ